MKKKAKVIQDSFFMDNYSGEIRRSRYRLVDELRVLRRRGNKINLNEQRVTKQALAKTLRALIRDIDND